MANEETALRASIETSFGASLEDRVRRAQSVKLQPVIPNHWFSSAASECVRMFVAGHFYGCISVAQAYVDALSKFLLTHHKIRAVKDVSLRWKRLMEAGIVTKAAHVAATGVYADRNDYHHLNSEIPQEFRELEARAHACLENLHSIESDVFSHSFLSGKIVPSKPEYWGSTDGEHVVVNLRQRW